MPKKSLLPAQRAELASVDWETHDQFRGLVRALQLYFAGVPFEEILDSAHMPENTNGHREDAFDEDDLDRLFPYLDSKTSA